MIIINIKSITQEADSFNIEIADPSAYYRRNHKPYDSGEISKHITPITYVDYEKNPEVIRDKNDNPVPPISLETLQKKVINIQQILDDVQKLIDESKY